MTISSSSARSAPFRCSCHAIAAVCAALASAGCSADALSTSKLGDTSDVVALGSDAPRIPVVNSDGSVDPFVAGNWIGHAEDLFHTAVVPGQRPTYVFPSGSSDIYVQITLGDGPVSGTLRFGSRDAPQPQADVPYGAGLDYDAEVLATGGQVFAPVEGAPYPLWEEVLSPRGSSSAIGLGYRQDSAFNDWCPLQPSLSNGDGAFSCVGAAASTAGDSAAGIPCDVTLGDGSHRDVDCNLLTLCEWVCDCREDGCFMNTNGPINDLWVAREGDQLIGNFAGAVFDYGEPGRFMPIGTVRFDRDDH
jgi:hypothetical protein